MSVLRWFGAEYLKAFTFFAILTVIVSIFTLFWKIAVLFLCVAAVGWGFEEAINED